MRTIERLAIKYVIIGISVNIIVFFLVISLSYISNYLNYEEPLVLNKTINLIIVNSGNIIYGIFILFDSIKLTKNKILISLLGFLIPIIGVCCLMFQNFLNQKNINNG